MTRVILTNKQTGQELPEAELVRTYERSGWEIRFDGASDANWFSNDDWDYREVRTFRNGDVLRRKDRDDVYVRYMFVVNGRVPNGRWLEILASGDAREVNNPSVLNDPEWELV